MFKEVIKNINAITLPTLVVTIIVLLILASVSISIVIGPNGLIETTQNAAINTKKEEIKERVQIKIANLNMKKIAESHEEATLEDVFELKENDSDIKEAYIEIDGITLVLDDYECKIGEKLQVESVSEYNPTKLRKLSEELVFCSFDREDI